MGNTNNVQRHADRAMQFAPFAALKGYYESIRLQERITEPRKELSEDEAESLPVITLERKEQKRRARHQRYEKGDRGSIVELDANDDDDEDDFDDFED